MFLIYNLFMGEIFGFFLAAFITICFARPVAIILKIPTLIVYIIAGILFGPSGFNLIRDISSLSYFYELGIILLMFSAGLELKIGHSKNHGGSLKVLYIFNMVIPGILGFLYGLFTGKYLNTPGYIFIAFYMITLFSSPAVEVTTHIFREFSKKMNYKKTVFSRQLIFSSVFADITSLFIFTGITAYYVLKDPYDFIKFIIFACSFFFVVLKGLPLLQEKILSKIKGMNTSEAETTTLIMLVIMVVAIGAFLKIPAIACSFFAGISLANININRRVKNNIDFITLSIFIPIVFIIVGARANLGIFNTTESFLLSFSTIMIFCLVRILCIYIPTRIQGFSVRDSLGFGFSVIPQLTGTLAIAVISHDIGILPDILFNSVIILSIMTSIFGPIFTRLLLFPGIQTQQHEKFLVEDFVHFDIKPFNLLTPICDIAKKLKDTEISVYPVVDSQGTYKGVIHLDDVRDTMFNEEIACLVISADVIDSDYPSIERDASVPEVISVFTSPGIHAIPVVEIIDGRPIYTGMLLLQDILPEVEYVRK